MDKQRLKKLQAVTKYVANLPVFGRLFLRPIRRVRKFMAVDEDIDTTYDSNIYITTNLRDHMESRIFWKGFLEGDRGEMVLLDEFLERDDCEVFFDVGAHVGIFSLYAAKRLSDGIVHSFEPLEDHVERLRYNIDMNGFENIKINKTLLSNSSGTGEISVPIAEESENPLLAGSGGSSTIEPDSSGSYESHTVLQSTLDDYVDENDVSDVDLIKVDVEGAELDVLDGGLDTLRSFHPWVLMELDKRLLERAGRSGEDVLYFWRDHGYSVHRIEYDGSLTEVIDPSDLNTKQNILAEPALT